ncbi:hypothetical protein R5R35_012151 [Gryllus longicercus]|uniref:Uncharacterized protein n=1 Tax=Gryllus longicercus TaxID=2509291 RepID=A0AAN9Z792_9ORTH
MFYPRNDVSANSSIYISEYLQLLDGVIIKKFLELDKCCLLADRYILAMIFTYFTRAQLTPHEFTPYNFFVALHLAHDIEEDDEELKRASVIFALHGETACNCVDNDFYQSFLRSRNILLERMKHRALVSLGCCLKVIEMYPHHSAWLRFRAEVHAGANRGYMPKSIHGASEVNDICWNCNKWKTVLNN